MTEEKKKSTNQQYKDKHSRKFSIRFYESKDADIIKIYESIPNKMEFLREAILRYAEEHNIKTEDE